MSNGSENAKNWLQLTLAQYNEYHDENTTQERQEEIREEIEQEPLSVEVRSGWASVGGEMEAEEYRVLLSWGGPSLQIVGNLGEYNQPSSFAVQHQDWGTPWETVFPSIDETAAVRWFLSFMWFGE